VLLRLKFCGAHECRQNEAAVECYVAGAVDERLEIAGPVRSQNALAHFEYPLLPGHKISLLADRYGSYRGHAEFIQKGLQTRSECRD